MSIYSQALFPRYLAEYLEDKLTIFQIKYYIQRTERLLIKTLKVSNDKNPLIIEALARMHEIRYDIESLEKIYAKKSFFIFWETKDESLKKESINSLYKAFYIFIFCKEHNILYPL